MKKEKERSFAVFSIVLIAIIGFGVYANSLGNQFVWDDDTLIRENAYIKNWGYVAQIFASDMGRGAGGSYFYYRPLQIFTYVIDYSIWRLNPFGYHLTCALLHILAALALYWLIDTLYQDKTLSLFTGALFVAHPVHTEAVSYLSGRGDPLAVSFMLLCLVFYIRQIHKERPSAYILMMLSYALALFSKENSVVLPGLILLYHCAFREKIRKKEFLSIAALTLVYAALRLTLLKSCLPAVSGGGNSLLERVPGFFVAITNYARLIVLPFGLHMEYGKRIFSFSHPKAILGILIVAALIFFALRNRKSDRVIPFAIGWFFVSLLPSSNIWPPLAFYMAEHYLYLASIGFFLILAKALTGLCENRGFRPLAIFLASALLIFYSGLTIRQNNIWRNSVTVYENTLRYTPDSARVQSDLGNLYNDSGEYEKAMTLIKKSIALDPTDPNAYNNLGNAYYGAGDVKEAINLYNKALGLEPANPKTLNNLGNAYSAVGDTKQAAAFLKRAIAANPLFPGSYYNLAVIHIAAGENDLAVELLTKAIALDPDFPEAYVNLGVIYNNMGKADQAAAMFKKALEIKPDYRKASEYLAVVSRLGKTE